LPNFSVKLSCVKTLKITCVKNSFKMENFRKCLTILALKVILGVEGAQNTSEESFPEQFVLAGFWFTLGFISGIFVAFVGIGAKKYLDPMMADNPDSLKRLSKIKAVGVSCHPIINTNVQNPKVNYIDSSDVSTTPLDRWVDEPTKKWQGQERTTNFQRIYVTPFVVDDPVATEDKITTPDLKIEEDPYIDHRKVDEFQELQKLQELQPEKLDETAPCLSNMRIRLDKNTDVKYIARREQKWLERVEASQMRLLGDQMVLEEQTRPINSIAYWAGLAIILAALAIAGFVVTKYLPLEFEPVKSLMDALEKMQTFLEKQFQVKMDSQAAQPPASVMSNLDRFINKWVD
jgi:hypothetical protein